jgi:hypothetical protein
MGTTANNNWPTPVQTDLVKDGWEAIKDLGDAIDTTLGVYAPSTSGLTLINTTTFSAVASQSVNSVFSATYDNYLLVFNSIVANGSVTVDLRLRASGTDSSASYSWGLVAVNQLAAAIDAGGSNSTAFRLFNASTDKSGFSNLNINDPFKAERTLFNGSLTGSFSGNAAGGANGGVHSVATSYDGFTILSSGTITGSVNVYGYNK